MKLVLHWSLHTLPYVAGTVTTAQMPVDFFESCTLTNEIEYGGNDLLEVYNRNLIKQRLATGSQYVACTKVRHSSPVLICHLLSLCHCATGGWLTPICKTLDMCSSVTCCHSVIVQQVVYCHLSLRRFWHVVICHLLSLVLLVIYFLTLTIKRVNRFRFLWRGTV